MASRNHLALVDESQGKPCQCGRPTDRDCPRRASALCWHSYIDESYDMAVEAVSDDQFERMVDAVEKLLIEFYSEPEGEATRGKAQNCAAHVLQNYVVNRPPIKPKEPDSQTGPRSI